MFNTRLKHYPHFVPVHVPDTMVDMENNEKLQAFIADIEAVYKKHNMRITAHLEVEDVPKPSVLL